MLYAGVMARNPLPLFLLLSCLACSEYEIADQQPITPGDTGQEQPATLPVLSVEPLALDFGSLQLGEETSGAVQVSNVGDGELEILSLDLSQTTSAFSLTQPGSTGLAGGESTEFIVSFQPDELGEFQGQVLLDSDAPFNGSATVSLLGSTLWPGLLIAPESHDFGEVELGLVEYLDVLISNEGEASATLSGYRFTSTSESELLVHDEGDLADLPLVLGPGDRASTRMRFSPQDEGSEEASLIVETDDPANSELLCQLFGTGPTPKQPEVFEYDVQLQVTADDACQAWIDGSEVTGSNSSSWSSYDTASTTLQSGDHAIAVYATDQHAVIAGFIAVVQVDGAAWSVTGDGSWLHSGSDPGSGWEDPAFDDSSWAVPISCSDTSPWGSSPADLLAHGATWVWWTSNCRDLGEAWFRLDLTLP